METRRHKRYKLDLVELGGKMFLIDDVEVLEMSQRGLSLRTSKGLNAGKEYLVTLFEQGRSIEVKGIAVESRVTGTETLPNGQSIQIHTARIKFRDGQTAKIMSILDSAQRLGKEDNRPADDRRLHARFRFTMPLDTVLSHSPIFSVRKISMSGMLIECDQVLKVNSVIPMNISFNSGESINISGRIICCDARHDHSGLLYELGVEFLDLKEKDTALLKKLTDDLLARGIAS